MSEESKKGRIKSWDSAKLNREKNNKDNKYSSKHCFLQAPPLKRVIQVKMKTKFKNLPLSKLTPSLSLRFRMSKMQDSKDIQSV